MSTSLLRELKQTRPYSTLEEEALVSVARTGALLDHAVAELLRPYGITATQYNVLRILRGAGPEGLCRNEVRDRLVSPVPDATRLLDRMVELGLVSRNRDTPDRRFVTTRITPAGLALLERLDQPIREFDARHFSRLGPKGLKTLVSLLAQVRESLL